MDGDHFHPSISHCIFMCIVGSENMLRFEVTINGACCMIRFTLDPSTYASDSAVMRRRAVRSRMDTIASDRTMLQLIITLDLQKCPLSIFTTTSIKRVELREERAFPWNKETAGSE